MPVHELIVVSIFFVSIVLLIGWTKLALWDWQRGRDH